MDPHHNSCHKENLCELMTVDEPTNGVWEDRSNWPSFNSVFSCDARTSQRVDGLVDGY